MSSGGGGASQPTSQTVTQTNIPEYARPYVEQMLGRAQALSTQDIYQPYTGQQLAGINPLQTQALKSVEGMTPSAQLEQGTALAGSAGLGGLMAGQQYAQQATSPEAIKSYMSPYMQNVVEAQKRGAVADYARNIPQLGAGLAKVGGLGGTRGALMQAEAQRNLYDRLAGIEATGAQSAFEQARQAQQYGADLGIRGLGTALQGASTLGQLGQTQFGQGMGIYEAQQRAGAGLQAQEQAALDLKRQEFENRLRYPYQQIGFFSDMLRGLPLSQSTQTMYSQAPSAAGQVAGLGLGLGSLFMAGR